MDPDALKMRIFYTGSGTHLSKRGLGIFIGISETEYVYSMKPSEYRLKGHTKMGNSCYYFGQKMVKVGIWMLMWWFFASILLEWRINKRWWHNVRSTSQLQQMTQVFSGAYNSSNLQLANASMEYNPLYDADKGFNVMPSSFHDVGDVEFQDNWGRVWVDIGTLDYFALDVLLNCLTVLSSEYLGIQQVVFGGNKIGDWEEGMKNPEDGYKYFKI